MDIISEVKKKREFSGLPDSIVKKVVDDVSASGLTGKFLVKDVRSMLRKYFGVFLTNRVVKPKDILDFESVLKSHKSSMKREYSVLYSRLKDVVGEVDSIIDFGCGVNGFSYEFLKECFGDVKYIGIEASNQIVKNMNLYFEEKKFALLGVPQIGEFRSNAQAYCLDLFNLEKVDNVVKNIKGQKLFFCFQVVDALEKLERDFSKRFLLSLKKRMGIDDWLIISLPMVSLSSKSEFKVKRNWLFDFLSGEFDVAEDFILFGERFLVMQGL